MIDNYIVTYTGRKINPSNPSPSQVSIIDIAYSLSKVCRSNGHSDYFYSVLQHLINCAKYAKHAGYDERVQFEALMHDTEEYIMHDIHPVLKKLLSGYKELTKKMQAAIYERFKFTPMSDGMYYRIIKPIDTIVLALEKKHNMKNDPDNVKIADIEGINVHERPMDEVREEFLEMFYTLHKKVVNTGGKHT